MLTAEELEQAQAFHAEHGYVVIGCSMQLAVGGIIPAGDAAWSERGDLEAYSWRILKMATKDELVGFQNAVGRTFPIPYFIRFFYRVVAAD